ncbi:MAG: hypothetical protein ABGY75_01685 [Gemmataceae bacterium]
MLKRMLAAAIAAAVSVSSAPAADEAVTIKVRRLATGDVVKQEKSDEATETTIVTAGLQETKQEQKSGNKAVFVDEILEADGKAIKPAKLKRTYETAEVSQGGKKVDVGLAGKTVLIEKGKDKYTYTIDGKPVNRAAAAMLEREFDRPGMAGFEEVMIPKKPVKVGDTWSADPKEMVKLLEGQMGVDPDNTKVTGKLLKVYDQSGAKFGVLEFALNIAVTTLKTPMGVLNATAGSTLTFTITMDGCIDGSQYGGTSKGTVKGDLGIKMPNTEVKITLDGTMDSKAGLSKK